MVEQIEQLDLTNIAFLQGEGRYNVVWISLNNSKTSQIYIQQDNIQLTGN